jgi:hypothetical protein
MRRSVFGPPGRSAAGCRVCFPGFTRLGVDAAVVGWTLVVAGVISSTTAALLLAVGRC